MQFGNPLVASAQVTQGQIVSLGQVVSPGFALAVINASVTNGPFSGILIHVHNPGGAAVGNGVWASVTNGEGHTFSGALPAQPTIAALAVPDYYAIIPCECGVADALQIQVQFVAPPPANTVVSAYGLTDGRPHLVRPDGRSYPLSSTLGTAAFSGVAGPLTVVNSPAANARLLVGSWYSQVSTAGALLNVTGTVNGVALPILMAVGTGQTFIEYDSGLLLDPATPITANASAAITGRVTVLYDIVPA